MDSDKKGPGRPPLKEPSESFELTVPAWMARYLDEVIGYRFYGENRQEVTRSLLSRQLELLVEKGQLKRQPPPTNDLGTDPEGGVR
jgi:hypothetical protein